MKLSPYWAFCMAGLISCTDSAPDFPASENRPDKATVQTVSIEDAFRHADRILSVLEDGNTRSVVRGAGHIASYDTNMNSMTRASEQETAFYLINYEDESGFVLLDARQPNNPVIAFSPDGNLNIADTTFNIGLSQYITQWTRSSVGADPTKPSGPDSIISYQKRYWGEPLLSERMQCLDQREAPCVTEEGCPACCVAVTMTQLMSFYNWPTSYKGVTLDWDGMKNGTKDAQINWVIDQLSDGSNLNVHFTPESSGTLTPNSPIEFLTRTATNWSYTAPGSMVDASTIFTGMYVNHDRRVLATKVNTSALEDNHVFCVDGYIEIVSGSYPSNQPEMDNPIFDKYVHVVWGLGKNANGYFRWNTYDNKIMGDAFEWDTSTPEIFPEYGYFKYYNGLIPKR